MKRDTARYVLVPIVTRCPGRLPQSAPHMSPTLVSPRIRLTPVEQPVVDPGRSGLRRRQNLEGREDPRPARAGSRSAGEEDDGRISSATWVR